MRIKQAMLFALRSVKSTSPVIFAVFGNKPMIENAVMDLPQPDSPTNPMVSPSIYGEADIINQWNFTITIRETNR